MKKLHIVFRQRSLYNADMRKIGEAVAERIRLLGLIRAHVARELGMDVGQFYHCLTGKVNFTLAQVERLSEILGEKYITIPGEEDNLSVIHVPVFNGGAGQPSHWTDEGYPEGHASQYESMPAGSVGKHAFGVRVHGDSMEPSVKAGWICIVDPDREPVTGKIVFYTNWDTEERLIKRLQRTDAGPILLSDNPQYPPVQPSGRYKIFPVVRASIDATGL